MSADQEGNGGSPETPSSAGFFDRSFDNPAAAKWGCIIFIAVIVLVLGLTVSRCSGTQAPDTVTDTPAPPSPESELLSEAYDTKVQAEANLKAGIKDADSAKFRNEFVSRLPGGNLMLCGEINSKNGFGAYTGFKRFIASPNPDAPNLIEGETTAADNGSDNLFQQAYGAACGNPVRSVD